MFNDLENLFRFDKTNIHQAGKVAAKAYFEADDFSNSSMDSSKQMKFLINLMNLTFRISQKFGWDQAQNKKSGGVTAWLLHKKAKL